MKFKIIFYLLGRLLIVIGLMMGIPAAVSYYFGEIETFRQFILTLAISIAVGISLSFFLRKSREEAIGLRDSFLLVTLSWLAASAVGALPFHFSHFFPSFVDAFFESVSGFTTTGATVLSNIEALPNGLLFWRSLSQWIGGMGIIVLAVAILPQLSVGGMQLMKNEMPGLSYEQLRPRVKQTAMSLWKIYILFSVIQIFALNFLGMNWFESFCHMFSTMSTGGFSPRNSSIIEYSGAIQMTITFFMFVAGANFVLYYYVLRGSFMKLFQDIEWQSYAIVVFISFAIISASLSIQGHYPFLDAMRLSIFQVLTITSTTGFISSDFEAWPHLSKGILFLLMFVGGCAGSTAGGFKQVRLLLLFKRAQQSITQHIFPKAVLPIKMNKRVVPESIMNGIYSLFLIYIVFFALCSLILLAFNIDFVTATSAVVASLGNVGPGFAGVGATANYAFLPAVVKLVLCICMVVGRLEIFTVLVLFFPATWRR